jgi:hypothetical protein
MQTITKGTSAHARLTLYRTLRRITSPVTAHRLANEAMSFLDAAKPLVVVSCGALVIRAAFVSLGGI